ncbi:hypothetical protein, partial [Peptoanaerobacter stomatis]|uniref:hypothetical protein n=1 Tax=Peptoanaerobacter stomatis TaxID=796937 RepID=UPI003FA0A017
MKNDVIVRYNEILEGILINYVRYDDINDILYQAMRKFEELEKLREESAPKSTKTKDDVFGKIKKQRSNRLDLEKEILAYTNNENLINTLIDFCEMRESIGKKINTRGTLTRLFNRLNVLSNNNDSVKIQLLDKAILNNWQSVWSGNDDSNLIDCQVKCNTFIKLLKKLT